MYTIGSLSDLISGADTPNKLAVKVKEVQYKKPIFKKTSIIKTSNEPTVKAPILKKGKQQLNQIKSEKPCIKSQINRPAKFNKQKNLQNSGKPVRNEGEERSMKQAQKESTEETSDTIIKNKKLNNAEKRKMLKRIASDSETPKKIKKPKLEKKNNSNRNDDKKTKFVGNVPLDTKENEIKQFFLKYGAEIIKRWTNPAESNEKKTADGKQIRQRCAVHINLPKIATETEIREIFKKCGKILSVRILKRAKKGYFCYINFENSKAVANAVNLKNPTLRRSILKVTECKPKQKVEKQTWPAIIVKKLPLTTTSENLRELFKDCGNVKFVHISIKKSRTAGIGFVKFETEEGVEKALKKKVKIGDNEIIISRKTSKKNTNLDNEVNEKESEEEVKDESEADEELIRDINGSGKKIRQRCAVHINLPKIATETEIREIFKKCGKILSVRILQDAKKGYFCYINFENSKAVEKAVNLKNPTLRRSILKVTECKPKEKVEKQTWPAIYVTQLPLTTTSENLRELFEDCGNVKFVHIFVKRSRATGVGFVNFETEEEVEKALKKKVKIGDNEINISRKTAKKKTNLDNEVNEKESDEEVEDESEADEELIRDINGSKKWDDDSDSSEADEDEDVENDDNEDDDNDDDDDANDDDSVDNNEEN